MSSIVCRAHFFISKNGYPLINSVTSIAGCNTYNKTVKTQVHLTKSQHTTAKRM